MSESISPEEMKREGVRLASVAGAIVAGRLACSEAMPTLEELTARASEASRGS